MSRFEDVVLGRDPSPRVDEQNAMAEGRIKDINMGGVTFTIHDWDSDKHAFGPAPYAWDRQSTFYTGGVQRGDRCLVVFLGAGVENPWVIGWWPA